MAGCDGRFFQGSTQSGPGQTGAGTGADGSRRGADMPDDSDQFQLHPFYALPPGAKDFEFDRNGQLEAFLTRANTWFAAESGGSRLRFDLAGGKPDITFLRLTRDLPAGTERMKALAQELKQAGFRNPRKYSLVFYGGANPDRDSRVGIGQIGLALVELDECKTGRCEFGKVERHTAEGTMLHEVLHALGAVPEGAPNYYDKTNGSHHTGDLAADIMNVNPDAVGTKNPVRLDPGRDDYFGHGRQDLLDVARSLLLDRSCPLRISANPLP
jgi:hypothetical protein